MPENSDKLIKEFTEKTFNVKGENPQNLNVLAAMIAASAGISMAGDISHEEEVITELMSVYDFTDNEELLKIINLMSPQYVKDNIGFAVDYRDYGQARYFYETHQETLDAYYASLNARHLNRSESHNL